MSKLFKYFGDYVKQGEYIFREGDEADALYMIHKGKVMICKTVGNVEKRIQVLEEGEFVGEMAIIDSMPRSADAIAVEDCQLIKMDHEAFDETIQKNKQFSMTFIRFLSQRVRDTTKQLTAYTEKDRTNRVYGALLKMMLSRGKKDQTGKWILVSLDNFINDYNKKNLLDREDIMSILNNLMKSSKIRLKTDKKGQSWIAVKITE